LECDSQRAVYTHQGLHLITVGKEMIAKQIASLIYKSVGNKEEPQISLKWKAVQTDYCNYGTLYTIQIANK